MRVRSLAAFALLLFAAAAVQGCEEKGSRIQIRYSQGPCFCSHDPLGYQLTLVRGETKSWAELELGEVTSSSGEVDGDDRFNKEVSLSNADFQRVLDLFEPGSIEKPPSDPIHKLSARYRIEVRDGHQTRRLEVLARQEGSAGPMIRAAEALVGYDATVMSAASDVLHESPY